MRTFIYNIAGLCWESPLYLVPQ